MDLYSPDRLIDHTSAEHTPDISGGSRKHRAQYGFLNSKVCRAIVTETGASVKVFDKHKPNDRAIVFAKYGE